MIWVKKLACSVGIVVVAGTAVGDGVPAGTVADIEQRTRPFGELCLEGDDCGGVETLAPVATQAAGRSGADVYTQHCHLCHQAGLNDAPRLGDEQAWAPRLAKGIDELLRITQEGVNAMPPMGTCMTCSDGELRAAIEHMSSAPAPDG